MRVRRAVAELFAIIPDFRDHLERHAERGADGRVFLGGSRRGTRGHGGLNTAPGNDEGQGEE